MAELVPYPFAYLIRRLFRELDEHDAAFDLPSRSFVLGDDRHDFAVRFHGQRASTPLGPAAGPQSQMAQNIVLSWLTGGRIMELKTVQINDELEIPRPCIDMQTVGYNVEWSQELKLEQSLEEYVKGAMLVEMLRHSGRVELAEGFGDTIYDMSVGYDLAGITTDRVKAFLAGMKDASSVVDRLREQIPDEFKAFRDLDYPKALSRTLTLSTFHGCPPDEIESIIEHLLDEERIDCIVKLNPMLLGPARTRELLNDQLGFHDVVVPDSAFERDTRWDQAVAFVGRLKERAHRLGLGFGIKLTNTLIVENRRDFFPSTENEMYLSGRPLHVLAMDLAGRCRDEFGPELSISFSAGIERANFADAVAMGLVPVTVCSDLLKPGGYGRAKGYFDELARRMDGVGATCIDDFIIRAFDHGATTLDHLGLNVDDPRRSAMSEALESKSPLAGVVENECLQAWRHASIALNTKTYVERVAKDPRYHYEKNTKLPRKIGSQLELFDCITCDKCIPVCPNDANFDLRLSARTMRVRRLVSSKGSWSVEDSKTVELEQKHQIANFADFCNECGNCDVFCPEDGGPYVVKPRFFGSLGEYERQVSLDGFFVERREDVLSMWGRMASQEYRIDEIATSSERWGPGFHLRLEGETIEVIDVDEAVASPIDLWPLDAMRAILDGIQSSSAVNYVNIRL